MATRRVTGWRWLVGAAAGGGLLTALVPGDARALDHADGPAARATPAADLAGLYAWMSADTAKLNLVLTYHPRAGADATPATDVQYVFHVTAKDEHGGTGSEKLVLCQFESAQKVSCWVGSDAYVTGDATTTDGLASSDGRVRVFSGRRDDPDFFNREGFGDAAGAARQAKGLLSANAVGCPTVDMQTAGMFRGMLDHTQQGTQPAKDAHHATNVLALVVQLDKSLVSDASRPVVGVWASTHRKP